MGVVAEGERDELLPRALVKDSLLLRLRKVVRRVHPEVFDVEVELGKVEVGTNQIPFRNPKPLIVDEVDLLALEELRNSFLAVALDGGSAFRPSEFRVLDGGLEVLSFEFPLVGAVATVGFAPLFEGVSVFRLVDDTAATRTPLLREACLPLLRLLD